MQKKSHSDPAPRPIYVPVLFFAAFIAVYGQLFHLLSPTFFEGLLPSAPTHQAVLAAAQWACMELLVPLAGAILGAFTAAGIRRLAEKWRERWGK